MSLCLLVFYACSTLFHHLPSILIYMLSALSFLYPCGCCAAAVVLVSPIERGLLFFYHAWQSHQSLLIHFILSKCFILCCNSSLLCGQSCITYDFNFYRWVSSCVATLCPLWMFILTLYILIFCCKGGTDIYFYASDLLVLVLYMGIQGQLVDNV